MVRFANRLSVKLILTILVFLVLLATVTAILILMGAGQTQRHAALHSRQGLETQGREAILELTQREVQIADAQLEQAEAMSRTAAEYMAAMLDQGGRISWDSSRLAPGPEGQVFDPDPARWTEVWLGDYLTPDADTERDLRDSALLDALLPTLLPQDPDATAISYTSPQGALRYYPITGLVDALPSDFRPVEQPSFTQAAPAANPNRDTVWSEPHVDPSGQGPIVTTSTPVYQGDEFRGVIGVDLSLASLIARLSNLKPTPSGYAFLVDAHGHLIAAPPGALTDILGEGRAQVTQGMSETLGVPLTGSTHKTFLATLEAMLAGQDGLDRMELGGREVFLAYAPLPHVGWSLGLVVPIDEITALSDAVVAAIDQEATDIVRSTLLLMAGSFLVALLCTAVLSRHTLTKPIEALLAGTRAVAAGNLDVRIPVTSKDELGLLAASFNQMTTKLAESNEQLQRGIVELKQMQVALRQSEERFRIALQGSPIIVLQHDRDLRYTWIYNPSPRFGRSPAEIIGKTDAELISPQDAAPLMAIKRRVLESGIGAREEAKITVDGVDVYYDQSIEPLRDELGRIIGLTCASTDITERKRAEDAYRTLVEYSLQGLVILQGGRVVFANPAIVEISGYTQEELFSLSPEELIALVHAQDRARVSTSIQDRLAGKPVAPRQEFRFVRKDGAVRWVETSAGVAEYQGKPAIQVAYIDISERRKAEEALRESEERFRRAFEHAPFGMALVGSDGRVLQVNQSMCRMFGYSEQELVGKTFQELTHPEDLEVGVELFQDLMAGRRDYGWLEKRYIHKDGHVIWTLLSTAAVRDPQGRPLYLISQIQDITERKEAEAKLFEKEEQYRSIFEATRDGLVINTPDGTIAEANPAFCEMHGYTYEDLVGMHAAQLIHPDDHHILEAYLRTVVAGRAFQAQATDLRKDGAAFHVEVHGAPFTYRGQPHVLGVVRDVTERMLARQMLEERVAARTRELAALYDVTAVASASLDLPTVLERSLDRVLEVMGCAVGGIHLLDEAGEVLHLAAWLGLPPEVAAELSALSPGDGLVGGVLKEGQPLVVPDISGPPQSLRTVAHIPGSQTYVGAPVHAKGQVVGVLSVFGVAERQFTAEEVALLASIADQVGVAVENARLYQRAEQLAVMEERERLARELHDSVTQSLYSVNLMVETGRRAVQAGDLSSVEGYLTRLGAVAQDALKEMRLLVYELRPSILETEGLVGALQQRLDAVEGRAGVEVRLLVEGQAELSAPVEEALYRIAQEALNNALRHAAATSVTVRLCAEGGRVRLEIEDNGQGFDPEAQSRAGGMGLVTMRQRAEQVGSAFAIQSVLGQGTRVQVTVQA